MSKPHDAHDENDPGVQMARYSFEEHINLWGSEAADLSDFDHFRAGWVAAIQRMKMLVDTFNNPEPVEDEVA